MICLEVASSRCEPGSEIEFVVIIKVVTHSCGLPWVTFGGSSIGALIDS